MKQDFPFYWVYKFLYSCPLCFNALSARITMLLNVLHTKFWRGVFGFWWGFFGSCYWIGYLMVCSMTYRTCRLIFHQPAINKISIAWIDLWAMISVCNKRISKFVHHPEDRKVSFPGENEVLQCVFTAFCNVYVHNHSIQDGHLFSLTHNRSLTAKTLARLKKHIFILFVLKIQLY